MPKTKVIHENPKWNRYRILDTSGEANESPKRCKIVLFAEHNHCMFSIHKHDDQEH